jgi:uncharacterized membrane protein YobD (UPF0266 family)
MTPVAMIITYIAFALFPVCCAVLIPRARMVKKRMGKLEAGFNKKGSLLHVLIFLSTPTLVGLNFTRKLDAFTIFAVCGVGVLGFAIGLTDLLYTRMSGIYGNGLIWASSSIFYADIDEFTRDGNAITIMAKDRTRKLIILKDAKAVERICEKLAETVNPLQ